MDAFKDTQVGKFSDLREEIEKLPTEELKALWDDREFYQFLDELKDLIIGARCNRENLEVISDYIRDRIIPVIPFLPELGYSFDGEINVITSCWTCAMSYSQISLQN